MMREGIGSLGDFFRFVGLALRAQFWMAFRGVSGRGEKLSAFWDHFHAAGWGSLVLLMILSVFAGLNLSVQAYDGFQRFDGQSMLGRFTAVGGVRELFPVLAAVVCGAKVGADLSASLATMRISSQVDALEVMGVDPYAHLIAPRLWGLTLAMPALCLISDGFGMLAAYLNSVVVLKVDAGRFFEQLRDFVTLYDLGVGMTKGLIMGWLVAVISCFYGFSVRASDGANGVGTAANRSIVASTVTCIVVNLFLSYLFYGFL